MIGSSDPNEIVIDKEGVWHFRGAEMKRFDIIQYLYKFLKRDQDGNYLIEIEDDRCRVRVEDAPFVIRGVSVAVSGTQGRPGIEISLNDGSTEGLNLESPLQIGEDHVMYCRVKRGEYEARFSRAAYYQICKYIDYDRESDMYRLVLDDMSYPLTLTGRGTGETCPADGSFCKPT